MRKTSLIKKVKKRVYSKSEFKAYLQNHDPKQKKQLEAIGFFKLPFGSVCKDIGEKSTFHIMINRPTAKKMIKHTTELNEMLKKLKDRVGKSTRAKNDFEAKLKEKILECKYLTSKNEMLEANNEQLLRNMREDSPEYRSVYPRNPIATLQERDNVWPPIQGGAPGGGKKN